MNLLPQCISFRAASLAITASSNFQMKWRHQPWQAKSLLFKKLAFNLRERRQTHAKVVSSEMGKPLTQAVAEVLKCAELIDFYVENGETFIKPEMHAIPGFECSVTHEPLGVIFGVMPWNFPLWQVYRWAVPTLLAGNTAVFKHAGNTSQSAKLIVDDFTDAGFDARTVMNIQVAHEDVPKVIEHAEIRGFSFTGSSAVGRRLAAVAGFQLKKSVIELGGSDACVLLESAGDIAEIAKVVVKARMHNSGQSCISPKRVIVVANHLAEFLREAVEVCASLEFGVDFGTLASVDGKKAIDEQVAKSISLGARLVYERHRDESDSPCYSPPRIITDVPLTSPLATEEVFGPVLVVIRAESDEEAEAIANSTSFGLGFSVFGDDQVAEAIARRADVGMCFINSMTRSDARMPFGGVKESGLGRECGKYGMLEFTNTKTLWKNRSQR